MSLLRQVAGADVGRQVGALLLEFVKFASERLGVILQASGGVPALFLQVVPAGLGMTSRGRPCSGRPQARLRCSGAVYPFRNHCAGCETLNQLRSSEKIAVSSTFSRRLLTITGATGHATVPMTGRLSEKNCQTSPR